MRIASTQNFTLLELAVAWLRCNKHSISSAPALFLACVLNGECRHSHSRRCIACWEALDPVSEQHECPSEDL